MVNNNIMAKPEIKTEQCLLCRGKGVITHPLKAFADENTGIIEQYYDPAEVHDEWLEQLKTFCLKNPKGNIPTAYALQLVNEIWQLTYSVLHLLRSKS